MAQRVPADENKELLDVLRWNRPDTFAWVQTQPRLRLSTNADLEDILFQACSRGWHHVAAALLESHLSDNITVEQMTAMVTVPKLRTDITRSLLKKLERFGLAPQRAIVHTALTHAVRDGNCEVVSVLVHKAFQLSCLAKPGSQSWSKILAEELGASGSVEMLSHVTWLHSKHAYIPFPVIASQALVKAAASGHLDLVEKLKQHAEQMHQPEQTQMDALLAAVREGQQRVAQSLIASLDSVTAVRALEDIVGMVQPTEGGGPHEYTPVEWAVREVLRHRAFRTGMKPTLSTLLHACRCGWMPGFKTLFCEYAVRGGAVSRDTAQLLLEFLQGPAHQEDRAALCEWLTTKAEVQLKTGTVTLLAFTALQDIVQKALDGKQGDVLHTNLQGLMDACASGSLKTIKALLTCYACSHDRGTELVLQFLAGPASLADRRDFVAWLNALAETPAPAPVQTEGGAAASGAGTDDAPQASGVGDGDLERAVTAASEAVAACRAAAASATAAAEALNGLVSAL